MPLKDELEAEVAEIFRERWELRDGQVVPDPEDLKLGNDGVRLDATILYADMTQSTKLVDTYKDHFAAEVYKTFLTCAARIIKASGGAITSYDGDRVMAVYHGGSKNSSAAKTALKINYAMAKIIRPKLTAQYPKVTYVPGHAVGIDTSTIMASRIGVKNDNDIVWVGRAANHAAKLCDLRVDGISSWITADVFKMLSAETKKTNGADMWKKYSWTQMDGAEIYGSTWTWEP